jgi:hypothetical protein
VFALLIVGVVVVVPVLYATDRIIKARAQARRVRTMSERLTAATARADEQHEKQQRVAEASAELTSVIPAINRPPLTLPGSTPQRGPSHGEPADGGPTDGDSSHRDRPHIAAHPRAGRSRAEHSHAHPRRSSRTGEHSVRTGEHSAHTGEQKTRQ